MYRLRPLAGMASSIQKQRHYAVEELIHDVRACGAAQGRLGVHAATHVFVWNRDKYIILDCWQRNSIVSCAAASLGTTNTATVVLYVQTENERQTYVGL